MNQVLAIVHAARLPSASDGALSSDPLFVELLALHEDMIAQLRTERRDRPDANAFLESLIEQHENAAAMLRSKLAQSDQCGVPTPAPASAYELWQPPS